MCCEGYTRTPFSALFAILLCFQSGQSGWGWQADHNRQHHNKTNPGQSGRHDVTRNYRDPSFGMLSMSLSAHSSARAVPIHERLPNLLAALGEGLL